MEYPVSIDDKIRRSIEMVSSRVNVMGSPVSASWIVTLLAISSTDSTLPICAASKVLQALAGTAKNNSEQMSTFNGSSIFIV